MTKREWKPCPVCGAPDMRHEPEGDEGNVIVTCTNLSCASNGGTNAHALLERITQKKVKHEPLFDAALELHDEARAQKANFARELSTMTDMTEAHEQQALAVESSLEGVCRTTLKLMALTRADE